MEPTVRYIELQDHQVPSVRAGELTIVPSLFEIASSATVDLPDLPRDAAGRREKLDELSRETGNAVRAKLKERIAEFAVNHPVVVVLVREAPLALHVTVPPSFLHEVVYNEAGEVLYDEDGYEVRTPVLDSDGNRIPVPGQIGSYAHAIVGIVGLNALPDTSTAEEPAWMTPQA